MTNNFPEPFSQQYDSHLKHLKLKGLQPKTIDAYAFLLHASSKRDENSPRVVSIAEHH